MERRKKVMKLMYHINLDSYRRTYSMRLKCNGVGGGDFCLLVLYLVFEKF